MSLICTTVTTWVDKIVLKPVEKWVAEQQKKCKKWPWPLNWICQFVLVLVKLTIWITVNIIVPITQTTCVVITGVIGGILLPFGAAIDAVCQKCNVFNWINKWWITPTKITFVKMEKSSSVPGANDYTFKCKCKQGNKEVVVIAVSDIEAQKKAVEACKEACGS